MDLESKYPFRKTLNPPYTSSSRISSHLFHSNSTSSFRFISMMFFIITFVSVSAKVNPFTVTSISIVERLSIPTIADTRLPPFMTNLSLYSETDRRFKNLSIMKFWSTTFAVIFFSDAIFFILPLRLIAFAVRVFIK